MSGRNGIEQWHFRLSRKGVRHNKIQFIVSDTNGKVEVHHLIEKRFLKTKKFKVDGKYVKAKDMMSVPLSKELHKEITRRWREVHQYGKPYGTLDKSTMKYYIEKVYKDMPALKEYALKYLNDTWVD